MVGALTTRSLDVIEKHVSAGDLRAALGVLRLLPREALHRAPTPPLTAQQGEDIGAILRARLARLETLPEQAVPKDGGEASGRFQSERGQKNPSDWCAPGS